MSGTILLLDDDVAFRALMTPNLQAAGLQVVECGIAAEAEFELADQHFDLLIVDGWLPDVNSIEWIGKLRQMGNQAKIIYVSAYVRDKKFYQKLTDELNVSLIVHKPITGEDMVRLVQANLPSVPVSQEITHVDRFQEKFKTIAQNYVKQLPDTLNEIHNLIEKAHTEANNSQGLIEEIRMRVHKLHGTAGPYGFPEVGELMGHIEEALSGDKQVVSRNWPEMEETMKQAINLSVKRNL
jgi:DNA-binding response OmpR family regulator